MSVTSPELISWLSGVRKEVERTNPSFAELNPVGWPIPFFGDIRTARVLTIGINPSPTEFSGCRWDEVTNEAEWVHRLLNYYRLPRTKWHDWFLPWEASLRFIGCSYEDGSAAHLDLSPRATDVMSRAPRQLFCDMVAADRGWFYDVLRFTPCARLAMTAGAIIRPQADKWQSIQSYVDRNAASHGATSQREAGRTRLMSHQGCVSLPMISHSYGPSSKEPFKLVESVFQSRAELLSYLR
jgi:hypothetical protein